MDFKGFEYFKLLTKIELEAELQISIEVSYINRFKSNFLKANGFSRTYRTYAMEALKKPRDVNLNWNRSKRGSPVPVKTEWTFTLRDIKTITSQSWKFNFPTLTCHTFDTSRGIGSLYNTSLEKS